MSDKERDELAEIIDAGYGDSESECPFDHGPEIATAILAAGYRKPRTITTMSELAALGNGAVILDVDGDVSQRRAGQWCGYDTAPLSDRKVTMFLPAVAIHEPAQ